MIKKEEEIRENTIMEIKEINSWVKKRKKGGKEKKKNNLKNIEREREKEK